MMRTKKALTLMLIALSSMTVRAQFYSLRTNLIGDATLNLNAELSMTANRRWSFHFPVQYNPFMYNKDMYENRKARNLTIEPGVRYWLRESYNRAFVGVMGIASRFDLCHIWDEYRYDGYALGLGAAFGYAWPIAKRWNFELEGGPGIVYASYNKYKCKHCGKKLGHESGLYLIPARVSASFVYLF